MDTSVQGIESEKLQVFAEISDISLILKLRVKYS